SCGTTIPIWLNGRHPTVEGQSSCGNTLDCCQYNDEMFVKNCNGFYVYYLNPSLVCPSRYCAGSAKRCPVGKWSSTGFEPCRDPAPVLSQPPVVKGPIVEADQSFHFQCEITYGPSDADQVFEVFWTFNGRTDPSIKLQTLTADQRVATLSGDKLASHPDTNVGCQVNTYYVGHEKDKKTYSSKTNYFGVQVSPGRLDIKDREGQKDVTVISTIPVVCDQGPTCCVDFTIIIDDQT
ncbi:unnamed protein product, partial [Candidula unifasciata]